MSWTPRLRTVLLASNLLVLALPVAGITLLRLYDSMLIRQTEAELIVQGAALASVYAHELEQAAAASGAQLGNYGRPARSRPAGVPSGDPQSPFRPAVPGLDLARHTILPPSPDGLRPRSGPDPLAETAGSAMTRILSETQRTSLAGLRILDTEGTVVSTSGAELGTSLIHRPEVSAALDGFGAAVLRRRDTEGPTPPLASISRSTALRVVVGFPIRRGERIIGAVLLARTPMSVRKALYRDRHYFVIGGIVLLFSVGVLARASSTLVTRPLRRLIEQTERVRRGRTADDLPLESPGTEEVKRLSNAVAHMASSLEQRADYIATFASNVSHELKTPLTSIRGTVELLADHRDTMSAEQLERFLSMLEKDERRLDRLVDRLLELARADVIRPGETPTELYQASGRVVARFRAEGVDVSLETDTVAGDQGSAWVGMGPEALGSVLSNLVDNARRHGGEDVEIRLRIEAAMRDRSKRSHAASEGAPDSVPEEAAAALDSAGRIRIRIIDDGPGISEANQLRVFDRFFTTRRSEGGSGLGLAIVRSLVEAHHGRIGLRSSPGETIFTVELPIAPEPTASRRPTPRASAASASAPILGDSVAEPTSGRASGPVENGKSNHS